MLNIADFGFAVELFVIYFCFFCWLFHSPSVNTTSQETKAETEQKSIVSDCNDAALPVQKLKIDSIDIAKEKDNQEKGEALNVFFQKVSIVELRKIIRLLKDANIIHEKEKTGGKGIGKVHLVGLIQQKIKTDKEAVISVLKDFNSEIATLI